ncbi:MAG: tetratricopeptide repeat protein, partial [Spirochaetota bacterium]
MDALMSRYERALFAADLPPDHDARTRLAARRVLASLRASVPGWRRVAGFLSPRPHRRVTMVALVFLLGAGATLLHAQESAEWYREQSGEAIASERYDRAINLLKEAQELFDASDEFFVRLGDLYYDEELYALALDEYLQAEEREPGSYEVIEQIAFTLGFLNRERESAEYWRRLVDLYPDRAGPVGNLGWLLFKLHRLEEGVDLLLDAWDRLGPDADLAMTLGTLYAEQYRFAEARDWYRRSIELASANESGGFVAVAFYNLSLIEKLFHRYGDALESTNRSLGVLPRPTGYLARGELHELRMDFPAAHADYLRAYDLDDETPLARLNLALLYRRFGRLEEALAFAESVLDEPDSSWLYYYGTDVTSHRMELHDLLADIHDGLSVSSRSRLVSGPLSWLEKVWDIGRHAVLGWYHRARFREYAGIVGSELLEGGNAIDGNWHLYRANESRPRVAAAYLERAERLDLALIPESGPFYAVEAARSRGDAAGLALLAL